VVFVFAVIAISFPNPVPATILTLYPVQHPGSQVLEESIKVVVLPPVAAPAAL